MIICQICQNEFKNNSNLSKHLKQHRIKPKEYYDKYLKKEDIGICSNENCYNETSFLSVEKGYSKYCSKKCVANSIEIKNKKKEKIIFLNETNLNRKELIDKKRKDTFQKNYGYNHPSKSPIIQEKKRNTCLEKYGMDHPYKTKEIQDKYKSTCLKKYNVDNVSKLKETKQKIELTCLDRYHVKNISQNIEIRNKVNQTNLRKYGNICSLQGEYIKVKTKQTWLKKYGFVHFSKSEIIKEKKKITCLKKYSVNNPFKSKQIREKYIRTCNFKYNTNHPKQSKLYKNKYKIDFYNKLINSGRLKNIVIPNFALKEYINVENEYSWICLKCNSIFEDNLDNGKIPRCPKCFPPLNGTSKSEQEVTNFIKEVTTDIEVHNRTILNGKELDIFIPSHNLAIEFNGLYWHSEIGGCTTPNYHLNKTLQCQEKGVQLIHIFEDEWIEKPEIVKSIIKAKLGLIINKIPARKCIIQLVSNEEAFEFLDTNHLQGFINGTHIGLFFNGELVSVLTYGKSRFNKNYETEIYRFCNKNNLIVQGALSKLIKQIKSNSILTYVDRRYGTGFGYLKTGFKLINSSTPNYFYTKDYQHRESRIQYQKSKLKDKLEIFDENLTEWQNMQLNNYDRIWDCGNLVYFSCD